MVPFVGGAVLCCLAAIVPENWKDACVAVRVRLDLTHKQLSSGRDHAVYIGFLFQRPSLRASVVSIRFSARRVRSLALALLALERPHATPSALVSCTHFHDLNCLDNRRREI